ncbi:MAG: 6-phosphogluconolactonase [Candidatus Saccharimonadales bacterium]
MKYILTAGWEDGVAKLARRLVRELADDKRVLWLVSGGSNIPASVQVMSTISTALSEKLTVLLADERYGPPGHADSNWEQLRNSGFTPKQARALPVLKAGKNLQQAAEHYDQLAKQAFAKADVVIAQLGIGDDGHIAGIKPDSPAARQQTALAIGYENPPLTRLTLTFPALRQITAAYAFAFGDNKHAALTRLQTQTIDLEQQPAQILKQLSEAYLYSDQIGEHA